MVQGLGDTKNHVSDSGTGAKDHGKVGYVGKLWLFVATPQSQVSVAMYDIRHEDQIDDFCSLKYLVCAIPAV